MRSLLLIGVVASVLSAPAFAEDTRLLSVVDSGSASTTVDPAKAANSLTIVIGGDLGFGASGQAPVATGAVRNGSRIPFDVFTAGLKPLLAGDVVFANLETVVSDRADLSAVAKAFNFRSHPSAVRHILSLGINAISTANNHAIDYGDAGLNETLRHLEAIRAEGGLQAFPGIGRGRAAALAPHRVSVNGLNVQISAIGIGGGGLGVREAATRPAMAYYGSAADLDETAAALAAAGGDVRLLSVHYGIEMSVRPSSTDEQRLRSAAKTADAHIVAGHHAHVAAGVQQVEGRFMFYGLGNLLHPGMQDMGRHGICRDYGMLARVHLARIAETFVVRAIEVTTLTDMHAGARARDGEDGRIRIAVLNHLAAGLDRPGTATGVRFSPRDNGTGLWCADGAASDPGAIGAMCRQKPELAAPAPELSRRIAASCGGDLVARGQPVPKLARSQIATSSAPSSSRQWHEIVLQNSR